jgi:hypothetical protein
VLRIAMRLHHHLHCPLQKNLRSSNAEPMLFLNSSVLAPCGHPFWRGSLRTIDLASTITTIILHPIGRIIDVDGGDRWGWGIHSRRWSSFDVGGDILARLLFFIGVAEDDDIAVTRRPKKLVVEFIEEPSGELLVPRDIGEDFLFIERKIHHWDHLGGTAMLMNR